VDRVFSLDRFGVSGPAKAVGEFFGFVPEKVAEAAKDLLNE